MAASFGERLKREREKRGMTLEEVSGVTKISVRNLRALEQEKFELLPGGIFNRGFVRAFAKHLDLDDDQVVADYMEAAGETVPTLDIPTLPVDVPAPVEEQREESTAQVPWAALVALLVLGTVLLVVWSNHSYRKAPENFTAVGPPAVEAQANPPAAPEPERAATSSATPQAVGVPRDPVSPVPASPNAGDKAGFDLSLRARDEVWLSTAVDGKPPSEATMENGQAITVHASERAIVRVGNAAALDVAFNGQRVLVRGIEGEVRTLTFTSAGLQAPIPATSKPN